MNNEERNSTDKDLHDGKTLKQILMEHIQHEESLIEIHHRVLFGDDVTNEKGMKNKVDEIHQMLVKVDGVGGFLKWIIIIGGALGAVKLWFIKP